MTMQVNTVLQVGLVFLVLSAKGLDFTLDPMFMSGLEYAIASFLARTTHRPLIVRVAGGAWRERRCSQVWTTSTAMPCSA